jgi:hypothetical protein
MQKVREALLRHRRMSAESRQSEPRLLPRRWVDLLLYLEETERARKEETERSAPPLRSP